MMPRLHIGAGACIVVTLTLMASSSAFGADCTSDFFDGKPPVAAGAVLVDQTLCFDEFEVGYSDSTRTPLWSAENLTATQLSVHVPRKDAFHPELQLPPNDRAVVGDYSRTGYDKGHMTPADDESTSEAERQSFSLANMVPQDPKLNRGLWAHIERTVRALAERDGSVYVVTGPVFEDQSVLPDGRVRVPSETFKAIYDPSRKFAGAYVTENVDNDVMREISIAALDKLTGLNVFPDLNADLAAKAGDLPPP